jgi:methylthioribose-1-phosphate isomerase
MPTLIRESVILEEDRVRILDRRVFPFTKRFVDCRTVEDVARAIEEMVTQSGGPFYAASSAMVLAARSATALAPALRIETMTGAARRLIATRPTNNMIAQVVGSLLDTARAEAASDEFAATVERAVAQIWERQRSASRRVGTHCAELLGEKESILTHCWAESLIIETLAATLRQGKRMKMICTETRPYLQGARLTAHCAAEMGIDTTVITDNMAAHAMDRGLVTVFLTAADRIAMSGHVVNKVGTLQIAIAAKHFAIPYFAMVHAPDRKAATGADVPIEERDPDESLHCMGVRTASPLARGWYPAFDVTPPELVGRIVTGRGVFAPDQVERHFSVPEPA